jgi:hypothetical protein
MFCHNDEVIAPKLIISTGIITFKPIYSAIMFTRISLLLVIIFSAFGVSKAQNFPNLRDFYESFKRNQYEHSINERSDISGSPWENAEFAAGEIYASGNQHYTGIPLRYNIYSNQVEFRKPEGGVFEINPPEIIDSVIIGESMYIYYSYLSGSKTQKSFFKVLTKGSPLLLLKMNIVLKDAEPPGAYKDASPASFQRMQDDFYLAEVPADAVKFSGKKEILELIKSHTAELEQFIKQNKTKFSRQEDLINLMKFYYTLK